MEMQMYVTFVVKESYKKLAKNKHYQKVRDHLHCTGKYRGAAHSICNLNVICQ